MRVLQLNIWARYGPYPERERRLKRLYADLRPTSARVVGQYTDGGAPSDHYGALAELELDGDRVGRGRGLEGWDEAKRELGWRYRSDGTPAPADTDPDPSTSVHGSRGQAPCARSVRCSLC